MICESCKTPIAPGERFCTECGRLVQPSAPAPQELDPKVVTTLPYVQVPQTPTPHSEKQQHLSQKKGNKKLWLALGLAVSVIIFGVIGLALYFFLSSPYLGVYKGPLAKLFPESVAGFQLISSAEEHNAKQQIDATDAWTAIYKKQNAANTRINFNQRVQAQGLEAGSIGIMAFNFPSVESAKAGLQNIKKMLDDATIIDQGTKRKGMFTVGERLVFVPPEDRVRDEIEEFQPEVRLVQAQSELGITRNSKIVAWTNGSVLFLVVGEGDTSLEVEKDLKY